MFHTLETRHTTPYHRQTEHMQPTTEQQIFDNSIKWLSFTTWIFAYPLTLAAFIQFERRYIFEIFKEKEEEN